MRINLGAFRGRRRGPAKPISACGTTISTAGSYAVTQNLTSASTSVPCIRVTTAFVAVTIDLGGFVQTGIGGSPGVLAAAGAGPLFISNGFIRSFNVGISAPGSQVTLRNVTLLSNQGAGAIAGPAEVTDSEFINNTGPGLETGNSAMVVQCTFVGNAGRNSPGASGSGLSTGGNATETENIAAKNGSTSAGTAAIATNGAATVTGNASSGNITGRSGFSDAVGSGTFEGNSASSNNGQGFEMGDQSVNSHQILGANLFIGISAVGNALTGFVDAGGSTFAANTSDNNLSGFATDAAGSTFVTDTADVNTEASISTGFFVFCPANWWGTPLRTTILRSAAAAPAAATCKSTWASERRQRSHIVKHRKTNRC
jgi:hypothetical protein